MQKLENVTEDQIKFAIDLLVSLIVEELADKLGEDPAKVLTDFVASETGQLLYDETSKLWWNGPSYIADMYLEEKSSNK